MANKKSNNSFGLPNFIFDTIGFVLFLVGSTLFYDNFNTLVIEKLSDNVYLNLILGMGCIYIAYKVFKRKSAKFFN